MLLYEVESVCHQEPFLLSTDLNIVAGWARLKKLKQKRFHCFTTEDLASNNVRLIPKIDLSTSVFFIEV